MSNDITATTALKHGLRPATMSAERLYSELPADGSIQKVWNGYGHINGVERFSAVEMRRAADGVEVLRPLPAAWGRVLMVYPLGQERTMRTLVKQNER